ncbi:MAG: pitrilysin family protein [Halopseudomonas sp.]|uniref:M16 family metallopeptidase n=1 Tax=Halopseudomonas sp. TaxID=2901191 RepID=UPI0030024008
MKSIKPLSLLRWLLALAALGLMIAVLLNKSPEPAPPLETAPVADSPAASNEPDIAEEVFGSPLPALESLEQLDLDTPPARRGLDLQHWTTSQGTRVYYMRADELPMLDVQLLFAAGASRDAEQPGLAMLTNALLNEGTKRLSADDIASGFERLGAQFGNGAYRDMGLLTLRSLTASDKLEPALALFAQVLAEPDFPPAAVARVRQQMLAGLQYRLQRPGALASEAFWSTLYPEHPYGSLPDGQIDSLKAITRADLQGFHQRYYSSGNAVIALVGAISRERAEQLAQHLADALPQGPAAEATPSPAPVAASHTQIDFNSEQTQVIVGQQGIERGDPDYAALYLGNQILGGSGFGSRLMEQVREKRGLSYSVSSGFTPMQAPGPFSINLQTRSDQTSLALEVVNSTLDTFIAEGPTDAELARAKQQILGEFPLSTASNHAIVSQLAAIGFYQLPLNHMQLFMDQIQAVTAEQIKAAFARHLDPAQRVTITVGPPAGPEPEAESQGSEENAHGTAAPQPTETTP